MEVKVPRSRCFFDIVIGGLPCGRIMFELYNDVVPKTCENFRGLCAGDQGLGKNTNKPLTYTGVIFHRVVKDFIIQAGDFSNGNGTGGESIYGGTFEDESFVFNHDQPFLLSMANRGKNTNGSQFFITTQPAPHLDNIHVVFGKVVGGTDVVRQIENLSVDTNSRPLQDVRISRCGELIRQTKVAKKKKEVGSSNEENASDDEERSSSRKKHKKRSKREKKPEKQRNKKPEPEEGELIGNLHPLASVSNINPDDIPDVPVNKFLLRADSRNYINNRNRYNDRGGGFNNRFGNNRDWFYNNRRDGRDHRKPQITKSGRTIKGRGVFRFRTPSRSRSRSRSATPVHWRKEEARVIKLSDYEKQDGLVKPANIVASTVAIVQSAPSDEQKRSERQNIKDKSVDGDKHANDEEKIDYNALDYEDEQQDMRQHLLEKRNKMQHPKLVQYPMPRAALKGVNEDIADKETGRISPTNENSQVMLSNKKSEVLAMALGVQVKTGEDPPSGDIRFSGFDRKMKQQQQMGAPGGRMGGDYDSGGRQMSPGMEAALALGNKTVLSSVSRKLVEPSEIELAAQNIKEREKLLHQRLMVMAGNINAIAPNVSGGGDFAGQPIISRGGHSRSKERQFQRSGPNRREKYHSERRDNRGEYDRVRDRRRERQISGGERRPTRRSGQGHRSGENRRRSRTKSRSRTPPMRGHHHISGNGGAGVDGAVSPKGTRNGTINLMEKTHTPSPDKHRLARKAEQILLLKKKMEAEFREQLLLKQRKEVEEKEQQRILLEKQRKAKEEAVMLDRAKRAQRDAAEKEKLLKTVKALKQLDKKPLSNSKDSLNSAKRKARSKRSPSSSSSTSYTSSSSTSSSSDSSVARKAKRHQKDYKKTEKSRRR